MLAHTIGGNSPAWSTDQIQQINAQFRDQSPEALLAWAAEQFGQNVVLTCSFGGASGMVLLDMVTRLNRGTPVLFLDTGLLFPETYALADEVERRYGVKVEYRRPAMTLEEQSRVEGPNLFEHDPDRCCHIRKVTPLAETLRPYSAWISGIRRDQSSTRASTDLVEWNTRHNLLKISPLAFWSERDVWRYIRINNVPYNQLLNQGYASLGCAPCTRPSNGSDSRSGRWAGFAKTECGIHM